MQFDWLLKSHFAKVALSVRAGRCRALEIAHRGRSVLLVKIISGGQSGVQRAALDVAVEYGLQCGGSVPEGKVAEDIPEQDSERFLKKYGLQPVSKAQPAELNVRDSHATLVISRGEPTGAAREAREFANSYRRPCLHLDLGAMSEASAVTALVRWLDSIPGTILNITGPAASENAELGQESHRIVAEAIRYLGRRLDRLPAPEAPPKLWSTLEGAKIAAPILSALLLAGVGFWISERLEASKRRMDASEKTQEMLRYLISDWSQLRKKGLDGREDVLKLKTEPYLRLILRDGIVEGWPLQRRDRAAGDELWLSPACNMDKDGPRLVLGSGVYVVQSEIRRIEVLDKDTSECAKAWQRAADAAGGSKP
jgi:hypothetical protein